MNAFRQLTSTARRYAFTALTSLMIVSESDAQCLSTPNAHLEQIHRSERMIEGRVMAQRSFIAADGNIYTSHEIEVHRVYKGTVRTEETITTQGGVVGNLMQVVTPSVRLHVGDYGLIITTNETPTAVAAQTMAFYPIDLTSGNVYGLKEVADREQLDLLLTRMTGNAPAELRTSRPARNGMEKAAPQLSNVFPLQVTAGTRTDLTITGQGFGSEQGNGHVAFSNADDGGQSYVPLPAGPHYLSWTDTLIRLYVPSSTLYNSTVAGTGNIKVTTNNGQSVFSEQEVTVNYAKSEVVYENVLSRTMLVGMQQGGYAFTLNDRLQQLLGSDALVRSALENWACNTGVHFRLEDGTVNINDWQHDAVNIIGLAESGQLPGYMLGRTVTTFSGCGTANGLQWNLIEVDILLNADIPWCTSEAQPFEGQYDLETSLLHEIGHAHLMQHNNNPESPMYFQLAPGHTRRQLAPETDRNGGLFITQQAASVTSVCGNELHQPYDTGSCNLSVINSITPTGTDLFEVYPNPFLDELTMLGRFSPSARYALTDAWGRVVHSGRIGSERVTLPTHRLAAGIYLLSLQDNGRSYVRKLIKN